jgi:long-chain fatty acid transport protein
LQRRVPHHRVPRLSGRRRPATLATLALALALSPPGRAAAGGVGLYEIGTPDMGVAAAGRAAAANDASTAFGNPAGMTRLAGTQVLGGLIIFQVQTFFDPQRPPSDVSGGAGGNAGGFCPLPGWGGWAPGSGLYGVYSLRDDLKLGFSVNSYVGGSLDYDSGWTGRYFVQRADLLTMNFNPSIAYRVTDWFSVGAGFSVQYAKLVQKAAINNVLDPVGDGRIIVRDDNVGFGGNVGLLAEANPDTRFGLTYRSQVNQDFDDVATLTNLGPGLRAALDARGVLGQPVDMSLTVPQEILVSGYRRLTSAIAIMGNLGWQNWSQFGKPQLTVSTTKLTLDQEYQDTFGLAVGSQIRLMDPLLLSLGFAYDTAAVDRQQRTASFNIDEQYRWAFGLQYDWDDTLTAGMAYEFLYLGSAALTQSANLAGTLSGDYSTNHVNFVNFTLSKRF